VELRTRLEAHATAHRPEKRDANENGCECDCGQCVSGACELCSDEDCSDPNCLAERSLRKADANRRVAIRTAFAIS
jgi:hypothetical protein